MPYISPTQTADRPLSQTFKRSSLRVTGQDGPAARNERHDDKYCRATATYAAPHDLEALFTKAAARKLGIVLQSALSHNLMSDVTVPEATPSSPESRTKQRKSVRFSSQLESVKVFGQTEVPILAQSRRNHQTPWDLNITSSPIKSRPQSETLKAREENSQKRLVSHFSRFLRANCHTNAPVLLEKAFVNARTRTFAGRIAVQNQAYEKQLAIRFTLDNWKTYTEQSASYTHLSTPDGLDRFQFALLLGTATADTNNFLEFCIRYNVAGKEYWDNNDGENYTLRLNAKQSWEPRRKAGAIVSTGQEYSSSPAFLKVEAEAEHSHSLQYSSRFTKDDDSNWFKARYDIDDSLSRELEKGTRSDA
jgi:hypothetical protein